MLKSEQKSAIVEISEHPGFRVLLESVENLVEAQEKQVVKLALTPGKETEVIYSKARAEGARKLQRDLVKLVETLRGKSS